MTLFYLVAPALKGTSEYSILLGQKGNNYVREGGNRTHDQQGTLQSYSRQSEPTSRDIKRVKYYPLYGSFPRREVYQPVCKLAAFLSP